MHRFRAVVFNHFAMRTLVPFSSMLAGHSVPTLQDSNIVSVFVNHYIYKRKKLDDKKVHYEQDYIYLFLNYKSTAMNITDYVVTIFKYQIITDIQCSLKNSIISSFN